MLFYNFKDKFSFYMWIIILATVNEQRLNIQTSQGSATAAVGVWGEAADFIFVRHFTLSLAVDLRMQQRTGIELTLLYIWLNYHKRTARVFH